MRFTVALGQYKPSALVQAGIALSVKKFAFEPLSRAALRPTEPLKLACTNPVERIEPEDRRAAQAVVALRADAEHQRTAAE